MKNKSKVMKHKVLSVKQPWSFLICSGIKDIENRTWRLPEKYKGERVLIHASAKWDDRNRNMSRLFTLDQWQSLSAMDQVMMSHGILPTSAIIGSVRFVDCVINHPSIWAEKSQPADFDEYGYPAAYYIKIYNWVATDAVLFDKPILNVKGKLSFWDYDLQDEYVELINEFDKQK